MDYSFKKNVLAKKIFEYIKKIVRTIRVLLRAPLRRIKRLTVIVRLYGLDLLDGPVSLGQRRRFLFGSSAVADAVSAAEN